MKVPKVWILCRWHTVSQQQSHP